MDKHNVMRSKGAKVGRYRKQKKEESPQKRTRILRQANEKKNGKIYQRENGIGRNKTFSRLEVESKRESERDM